MEEFSWVWNPQLNFAEAKKQCLEEFEKRYASCILREAKGDVKTAAKVANIGSREFLALVEKYKLTIPSNGEKGDCYKRSAEFSLNRPGSYGELVHGYPVLNVPPFTEFGHAWVEIGDSVIDIEFGVTTRKELYYKSGKIDPSKCRRYKAAEILRYANNSGHWGPWEDEDENEE